jgi:hypothetical protein
LNPGFAVTEPKDAAYAVTGLNSIVIEVNNDSYHIQSNGMNNFWAHLINLLGPEVKER